MIWSLYEIKALFLVTTSRLFPERNVSVSSAMASV